MTVELAERPGADAAATGPLVRVEGLSLHFPVYQGILRRQIGAVKAVDGLTFDIRRGETLGLVGESGCGKSTTGRTLLRLYRASGGRILFEGQDIAALEGERLRRMRPRMQMIFQDPQASLNPRMTVGAIIAEPLVEHGIRKAEARNARVRELLEAVGLNPDYVNRYPHEFSGGQRQRIGIARALALDPDFIVCDEPIAALDVSIQAQVVNLMSDIQKEFGLAYLFIAHDLGVVQHISDRVAVMYLGRIVEIGDTAAVYHRPSHPYTRTLMDAVPRADPARRHSRIRVPRGEVPSPLDPPAGCAFHPRCPIATDICRQQRPSLRRVASGAEAACHHAE